MFENRIKFLLSIGGVALVILLILVLDGVFTGAIVQVTAYMDNTNYDLMVSQEDVKNLHMTSSFFPSSKIDEIKKIKGVKSAATILYSSDYLVKRNNRSVAYIIGFHPGETGGPWEMAKGTRDIKSGEIIIDERIAEKYNLKIGDEITTLGKSFKIGGLARGTVNIINSIAFIRFDDFEKLRGLRGVVSYGLVKLDKKSQTVEVMREIRKDVKGVTVMSREEFAASERKTISDMSVDIIKLMNFVAFLIGLAVLGLTVYTSTLSKLREYGILKAIGSKNRKLIGIVSTQAVIGTLTGLVLSLALVFILSLSLSLLKSNISIIVSLISVIKISLAALLINFIASAIPVIRIAGINPADVFRK